MSRYKNFLGLGITGNFVQHLEREDVEISDSIATFMKNYLTR